MRPPAPQPADLDTDGRLDLQVLDDGIALITLRPAMFTAELISGVEDAWRRIAADDSVRCVVVTGDGPVFSMGGTPDALASLAAGEGRFSDVPVLYEGMLRCGRPVISAIQGHAAGGGLAFGLYADIVVLSSTAEYRANFLDYGFTPGMGATHILERKLGAALAADLMLSARAFTGAQLAQRGAAVTVVDGDEVLSHSLRLARTIARKPEAAVRALKADLAARTLAVLPQVIEREVAMHEQVLSQGAGERVAAAFAHEQRAQATSTRGRRSRWSSRTAEHGRRDRPSRMAGPQPAEPAEPRRKPTPEAGGGPRRGPQLGRGARVRRALPRGGRTRPRQHLRRAGPGLGRRRRTGLATQPGLGHRPGLGRRLRPPDHRRAHRARRVRVPRLAGAPVRGERARREDGEGRSRRRRPKAEQPTGGAARYGDKPEPADSRAAKVASRAPAAEQPAPSEPAPLRVTGGEGPGPRPAALRVPDRPIVTLRVPEDAGDAPAPAATAPEAKAPEGTASEPIDVRGSRTPTSRTTRSPSSASPPATRTLPTPRPSGPTSPPDAAASRRCRPRAGTCPRSSRPTAARAGTTYSKWAALLDRVDTFDERFFRLSPLDAEAMDPQQRLFLEEAWHALEDAGHARDLAGPSRPWGVFVGCGSGDYADLLAAAGDARSGQAFLGNAPSVLPARIAYLLNLTGPTMAVDTACSSSLVAVHLAASAVARGECELALAGGVAVMSTSKMQVWTSQVGMLSPTGTCRPFDAAADGIVLGEGVGVVVLKRLRDALADGDTIRGVLLGSGMNGDGKSNGITAPNATAQAELLRSVYDRAGLDPAEIGYVEAHGTGTELGDPIEVKALNAVHGDRTAGTAALGSVKGNVGHTTMAAGVGGLIKVLLSLGHRELAPSLGFDDCNDKIDLSDGPFEVVTERRAWEPGPAGRRVGHGQQLRVQRHQLPRRRGRGAGARRSAGRRRTGTGRALRANRRRAPCGD